VPSTASRVALWAAVAAGALLRALAAATRHPWHDEHFTAWAARLPFAELIAALRLDSGPPLPYLLTGLLAIVLVGGAATRAFGPRAGLACAWLLAVHPLAIAWSAEGRAYSLLLLAAAWSWERIEAIAAGSRWGAPGLGAALAIGVWSHGLGLTLAGSAAVAAFTLEAPVRRRALAAVAVALLAHLPWLPVAASQPPEAIAWMGDAWRSMPALERLAVPVRLLPPAAPFGRSLDLPTPPGWLMATAAAVMVLAFAAAPRSRTLLRVALLAAIPALGLLVLVLAAVPAF
jgi:hypothetical protein